MGKARRNRRTGRHSPDGCPEESNGSATGRSGNTSVLWLCAVLFAATLLVYARTLQNGFVNWDDPDNISLNPYLNPPSAAGIAHLWTSGYKNLYVPLFYTSYIADFTLGGGKPWAFHLLNALLHAANAVCVFAILRTLCGRRVQDGGNHFAPFAGALVFAFHPLQVEAAAWATGRKDLLSGLFALLSVWQYLRWRDSARGTGRVRYAAAFIFFGLSLFAKPATVALPLALAALDWYALRRTWRDLLCALCPWFAVSAVWTLITRNVQHFPPEYAGAFSPAWTRPFIASRALFFYIWKTILPIGLVPVYGQLPSQAAREWWTYASLPAAAWAAWLVFRRRTNAGASAGIYTAFLLPVLGMVPFLYQVYSMVADRYAYLPMLGVALGCSAGIDRLGNAKPGWRLHVRATALAAAAVLAILSCRQTRFWRNSQSFWERSAAIAPNAAITHTNLGSVYAEKNDLEAAIREFTTAIRLNPRSATAHTNLALMHMCQGRPDLAAGSLRRAIAVNPTYPDPHFHLGNALRSGKDLPGAIREYQETLRLSPAHVQARVQLASAFARMGRLGEAQKELRTALEIDPASAQAQTLLDEVHRAMGRTGAAGIGED